MAHVICHDLIRSIISFIPLEDLRDLDRAHALFTREICKMGIQVFYRLADTDNAIDLCNARFMIIQVGPKKDVFEYVGIDRWENWERSLQSHTEEIGWNDYYEDMCYYIDHEKKTIVQSASGNNFIVKYNNECHLDTRGNSGNCKFVYDNTKEIPRGVCAIDIMNKLILSFEYLEKRELVISLFDVDIIYLDGTWNPIE